MLVYCNETRFYREILGISYEFGSELRKLGVLEPDAQMIDGRPLFSLAEEAITRHQNAVRAHRRRQRSGGLCYAH